MTAPTLLQTRNAIGLGLLLGMVLVVAVCAVL